MPDPRPARLAHATHVAHASRAAATAASAPLGRLLGLTIGCASAIGLHAEDDFTTWFTPTVRSYSFVNIQTGYSPDADTSVAGEEASWAQIKIQGLATVYHNDELDVAVWAGHQELRLDTDANLSQGTETPDDLRTTRIGATGRWVSENWLAGLSILGQDNGDEGPFDNETGIDVTGFGQYRFEQGWGIWGFVQYEGLVEEAVVVGGGFSYQDDQWDVLVGLPWTQVRWRPIEAIGLSAIYYGGPWYADATWFLHDQWRVGVGAQERVDGFYRDDRIDDDDQYQIRQRQIDLFVTWEFNQYRYLTVRGGWLFDRLAFEDEPYETDGPNRLDIDDAPVVEVTSSLWF